MIPAVTVDIGTTSIKLGLYDAAGAPLDTATHPTPTLRDAYGEIYDVDAIRAQFAEFVRDLDPVHREAIGRIAITGVGEAGGLVRRDLTLASPMILWHDHRGASYLDRLGPDERARIYAVTGLPVNANYGLSKTAWALDNSVDTDGALWLNLADYLAALLTGERWAERSLASRTLALDVTTGSWSAEVAGMLGVDVSVFPPLQPAGGRPLLPEAARELGLGADVWVVVAGHDHMVGAVGAGLRRGELLNSTGTTEGLLVLRDAPVLDDRAREAKLANGLACDGDSFTLFASIPAGGSAFATLQSMLGATAAELTGRLATLHERWLTGELDPAGVPLVLPRFRGSPPPDKNGDARAVIAGLRSDTTADDLVAGTFFGLVLQFRDVLDLFPERPERITVIGPAARNPLWLQLKADLLGMPLTVAQAGEVVSRGAQALASGLAPDGNAAEPREVHPDPARHARMTAWADQIAPLWAQLKAVSG